MSAFLKTLLKWNRDGWRVSHVTERRGDTAEVALYRLGIVRFETITDPEAAQWLFENAI